MMVMIFFSFLKGVRCARCVYPIRCTGCKIGRDVEQVSLLPGDSLAVQNCQLEDESVFESSITGAGASWLESDSSCSDKKESLSLADCLSAFSERYVDICLAIRTADVFPISS